MKHIFLSLLLFACSDGITEELDCSYPDPDPGCWVGVDCVPGWLEWVEYDSDWQPALVDYCANLNARVPTTAEIESMDDFEQCAFHYVDIATGDRQYVGSIYHAESEYGICPGGTRADEHEHNGDDGCYQVTRPASVICII